MRSGELSLLDSEGCSVGADGGGLDRVDGPGETLRVEEAQLRLRTKRTARSDLTVGSPSLVSDRRASAYSLATSAATLAHSPWHSDSVLNAFVLQVVESGGDRKYRGNDVDTKFVSDCAFGVYDTAVNGRCVDGSEWPEWSSQTRPWGWEAPGSGLNPPPGSHTQGHTTVAPMIEHANGEPQIGLGSGIPCVGILAVNTKRPRGSMRAVGCS